MSKQPIQTLLVIGEDRGGDREQLLVAGFRLNDNMPDFIVPAHGTVICITPDDRGRLYEQKEYWHEYADDDEELQLGEACPYCGAEP